MDVIWGCVWKKDSTGGAEGILFMEGLFSGPYGGCLGQKKWSENFRKIGEFVVDWHVWKGWKLFPGLVAT